MAKHKWGVHIDDVHVYSHHLKIKTIFKDSKMYKGRIDTRDLPDEYLQNFEDLSADLASKICQILDSMKDHEAAFNCLRKAYLMIISSAACAMKIPRDVFEQLLKGDSAKAYKNYLEMKEGHDRIDS